MATPIYTVRNPELSRWQSSVEQYLKEQHPDLSIGKIRKLPMMQGCWQHVQCAMKGETIPVSQAHAEATDSIAFNAYASQHFFNLAKSLKDTPNVTEETITAKSSITPWPYSTLNLLGWAQCAAIYSGLSRLPSFELQYRDYQTNGNNQLDFGVIDWTIPSGGKVLLIGDWGTGNDDSVAMLKSLVDNHQPDCIIHLGDIYYSGTPYECNVNFYNVIRNTVGTNIPVFTIPGNHEYYSYGYGFYQLIDKMNPETNPSQTQQASYFCLKTKDNNWQFLALDTGYNDHDPSDGIPVVGAPPAPDLRSKNDVVWAQDKLDNFNGQTIMLSHHQLFSQKGGMNSKEYGKSYANPYLYSYFSSYFKDKIAAWFWGHEHSFAMYQDGIFGLNKGRLIGASSYEESTPDDPYDDNCPMVPLSTQNYQLPTNNYSKSHFSNYYYPHVGAIMTFNGEDNPGIEYFSFPSWDEGDAPSQSVQVLTSIANETITPADTLSAPGASWTDNTPIVGTYGESDRPPAFAYVNDTLYMFYKNIDEKDKIYWDMPNYDSNTGQITVVNPQEIPTDNRASSANNDTPATPSYPSVAVYGDIIHLVYVLGDNNNPDVCWCTLNTTNNEWYKYDKIKDFYGNNKPSIESDHGPKITVFNDKLYVTYLSTDDDQTVYYISLDPTSGATNWSMPSTIVIGSSSAPLKSNYGICPAIFGNTNYLYLVYSRTDGSNLMGLYSLNKQGDWSNLGNITNGNNSSNIPTTNKGMSIYADDRYIQMVYVVYQNSHYVSWANYDILKGTWSGGLPIIGNAGDMVMMQSTYFPTLCVNAGCSFMGFTGNTSNLLWTSMILERHPETVITSEGLDTFGIQLWEDDSFQGNSTGLLNAVGQYQLHDYNAMKDEASSLETGPGTWAVCYDDKNSFSGPALYFGPSRSVPVLSAYNWDDKIGAVQLYNAEPPNWEESWPS